MPRRTRVSAAAGVPGRRLGFAVVAGLLLLAAGICRADQTNGSPIPARGWTLGLGFYHTDPGYVGYHSQSTVLPFVFYRHKRFFFAGITVGYTVLRGRAFSLSLVARPRILRFSASDSPQLAGMSSRRPSIDGGVVFSAYGRRGRLNLSLYNDLLGRNHGREVELGYVYRIRINRSLSLAPGLGASFENTSLTYYYYGVSPAESRPGRPAYTPGTAINPYVTLGLRFAFAPHWRLFVVYRYERFASSISDSPIVDVTHTSAQILGVSYRFGGKR